MKRARFKFILCLICLDVQRIEYANIFTDVNCFDMNHGRDIRAGLTANAKSVATGNIALLNCALFCRRSKSKKNGKVNMDYA